jgi:hypothetical protein
MFPPVCGYFAIWRQREAIGSDLVKHLQKNTPFLVSVGGFQSFGNGPGIA